MKMCVFLSLLIQLLLFSTRSNSFSFSFPPLSSTSRAQRGLREGSRINLTKQQRRINKSPFPLFVEKSDDGDNSLGLENEKIKSVNVNQLNTVCKVVASSDGKLPSNYRDALPYEKRDTLQKMDDIYHAIAHRETSQLKFLKNSHQQEDVESDDGDSYDEKEEERLVSVIKTSLENGGFELLSRRDMDLCDALNAGYLLRLSITPETKDLDPIISTQFYPDLFSGDNAVSGPSSLPFDGKILVFRRGYSSEISRGRLLAPKLDYLQASIVQKGTYSVTDTTADTQRKISTIISNLKSSSQKKMQSLVDQGIDSFVPDEGQANTNNFPVSEFVENIRSMRSSNENINSTINDSKGNPAKSGNSKRKIMKLNRYSGRKVGYMDASDGSRDALAPFLLSEITTGTSSSATNERANNTPIASSLPQNIDLSPYGSISCEYDKDNLASAAPHVNDDSEENMENSPSYGSFQLLERVSISNIVDFFSKGGRRRLIKSFLSESELVEPTYEEVVVVWRPLPDKNMLKKRIQANDAQTNPISKYLPKFAYDVAEIFDVRLPKKAASMPDPKPLPLEVRIFNSVPMANLPAVLPKTKLIFRPADALLFDLVSVFSLLAVLASQRFDNPKLDLIALVSVCLWLIRTVLRYSNKLARYDLLVNKFLTSKLSLRGAGAVEYIVSEASSQRALRASLVHAWMDRKMKALSRTSTVFWNDAGGSSERATMTRANLEVSGNGEISNEFPLRNDGSGSQLNPNINMSAALNDLESLNLIESNEDGTEITRVKDGDDVREQLRKKWTSLFDDGGKDEEDVERVPDAPKDVKKFISQDEGWRANAEGDD